MIINVVNPSQYSRFTTIIDRKTLPIVTEISSVHSNIDSLWLRGGFPDSLGVKGSVRENQS